MPTFPSMCYHSPSARYSSAYAPSNTKEGADKRGRKNLFKTALAKLTKKHKEKKAVSDNVYEVIVIYKDKDDDHEDGGDTEHSLPSSEYMQCQDITVVPKGPPYFRG